jgi:trk system potassium uptake protein
MAKQVAVFGLGRFGTSLAETLPELGYDVLAVDIDEGRVQDLASKVTHAVQGDATNEAFLKELDVEHIDVAIVAMGTAIQNNILCTLLLKKLGVPYVIARAENELHGSILEKIDADRVVYPERQMGNRVAHVLTLRDIQDYIPLLPRYGVAKLEVPPVFANKSLSQLGFGRRGKWGVAVLLLQRGNEIVVSPSEADLIQLGDILIVVGNDDKLEDLLTDTVRDIAPE